MTTIKATIAGGRLQLDLPVDWPNGTEVEIHPLHRHRPDHDGELSAEEIANTLAAMDQIQPFEMTDANDRPR